MDLIAGRTWSVERRPIRHVDGVLIFVALALTVMGLFLIYSATHASLAAQNLDLTLYVKKQVTALALGIILLLLVATFDYRFAKVYAGIIYGALVLLLVLVRTPFGTTSAGAQRWFQLAGFQFTPSEYMKLGLIVMLAAYLSEVKSSELTLEQVLRATVLAVIPMVLVFIQPDVGTTIVLAAILVGVLFVAGAKPKQLAVLALSAIVLLFGAFQLGVVKDYQVERLIGFLDPKDAQGAAYNKNQSEIGIGSGGVTGRGFLNGTQTNLDFIPEQHTDFIFTAVGEQLGFAGSATLLALFCIIAWRIWRTAQVARDPFGTLLCVGVLCLLMFQIFENVGMTMGIMPVTGIPLPFVSYGGSSTIAEFAAIGLVMNVYARRFS